MAMMDLDNMRENGCTHITVLCSCGRYADVDVSDLPGHLLVPHLKRRYRCSSCGEKPYKSIPAWHVGKEYKPIG